MSLSSKETRSKFLEFFASKQHAIVESAPIVIKNDPTLMFTNAGMNPFKDIFLGISEPESVRVANSQKCLRVSGKHNDLEVVGVDTYHHTMFEMLGNWSFGEYFKKEAIEWAWELLTKHYNLPVADLYVTVFEGDKSENLDFDQEAYDIWATQISTDKIIKANKKDNFWEMGDVGPCGPCSEIHIDLRSPEEKAAKPGIELVNQDHPQVIEIWNLVFMQYNRKADGSLELLKAKHVDTGMGFERLCMAIQGKQSNYDTDLFIPLIEHISKISGLTYAYSDSKQDVAFRVISDHVRAVAFAIADGQIPSNTGAGYVIRRILRRAIRYGFSYLNQKQSFIYQLVDTLDVILGYHFNGLSVQKELVKQVIREEEESFLRTLDRGIQKFNAYVESKPTEIDGAFAFELYDTYGFPIDLTELMANELSIRVDHKAFEQHLELQKERSRKATTLNTDDWVTVSTEGAEQFIGYDATTATVKIKQYRKVSAKNKEFYQIVLNETPFYAESGGQVGDKGTLTSANEEIAIFDTKKENNQIVHFANAIPSNPQAEFSATVNTQLRAQSAANHSATHLLHYALRKVLGTHVEQKGSLVQPNNLRFDFSHFSKVTDEQLAEVEQLVNTMIQQAIPLNELRETTMDNAQNMGAMALFGEKYGDKVRVIQFENSVELCGGTHVDNTAAIGYFKITSESAVAAGIRRIEAISSTAAFELMNESFTQLNTIKQLTKNAKNVVGAVEQLLQNNQALNKEIEQLNKQLAQFTKQQMAQSISVENGINILVTTTELDAASIKDVLFQFKNEYSNFAGVLGTTSSDKAGIHIILSDELVAKGISAKALIKSVSGMIKGGGGGQDFFATAGGKNPDGVNEALQHIKSQIIA